MYDSTKYSTKILWKSGDVCLSLSSNGLYYTIVSLRKNDQRKSTVFGHYLWAVIVCRPQYFRENVVWWRIDWQCMLSNLYAYLFCRFVIIMFLNWSYSLQWIIWTNSSRQLYREFKICFFSNSDNISSIFSLPIDTILNTLFNDEWYYLREA